MKILIAGGSGFIGKAIVKHQKNLNHEVYILGRKKFKHKKKFFKKLASSQKTFHMGYDDLNPNKDEFDVIINLAGESLNSLFWTKKKRDKILKTRVSITKRLVEFSLKAKKPPKTFVNASAVGIYGSSQNIKLSEQASPKSLEFLAKVCQKWEQQAIRLKKLSNINVSIIRLGIVLAKNGGILAKLIPLFKMGMGASLAGGKHFMSWIHMEDVVLATDFIIKNNLSNTFNLSAPYPTDNLTFSKNLAKSLGRPLIFNLPRWFLKLIFGKMCDDFLLQSQRAVPLALKKAGYKFKYQKINHALDNILNSHNRN